MATNALTNGFKWIKEFTADPASMLTDTAASTTLSTTFKPAKKGDIYIVCAPSLEDKLICVAINQVSTSGTLVATLKNVSSATVDPASQTFITIGL